MIPSAFQRPICRDMLQSRFSLFGFPRLVILVNHVRDTPEKSKVCLVHLCAVTQHATRLLYTNGFGSLSFFSRRLILVQSFAPHSFVRFVALSHLEFYAPVTRFVALKNTPYK